MGYRADVRAAKITSIRKYLVAAKGSVRQAARLAGVSRQHFYKIMTQLGERQWLYALPEHSTLACKHSLRPLTKEQLRV